MDHAKGTLRVTAAGWGSDPDSHPTTVLWDRSPLIGLKIDNKTRPSISLPNSLLDFLKDNPAFIPPWMKKANCVVFYEAESPRDHECGAKQVRTLTFPFGKPQIEVRLDCSFMEHDLIAGFECIGRLPYELV